MLGRFFVVSPLLFFLVFLFFSSVLAAQETSDTTFKIPKRELAFNTLPLAIVLGGGNLNEPRFTLVYKHRLKDKLALRVGGGISFLNHRYSFFNAPFNIIEQNDSLQLREYHHARYREQPRFMTGLEYTFGKGKVKWFAGADLFLFYTKADYTSEMAWFRLDTVAHGSGINTQYQYFLASDYAISRKTEEKRIGGGISPFFGLKWELSSMIGFSLQTGFDFNYSRRNFTHIYPKASGNDLFHSMDFSMNGLIQDFSIRIKF